jgi:hypothetical protein
VKHADLQIANWLWLGWARRYLKAGTDQNDARVLGRLHAAYIRMTAKAAQAGKVGAG